MRILSIQHGDFREACALLERGEPEPYFGMQYSVDVTKQLLDRHDHLIVSLNAPQYSELRGKCSLIGLPSPRRAFPLPGAGVLAAWKWGRQLRHLAKGFSPDRLLLRTGNAWLCIPMLEYAVDRNISTLVLMANTLPPVETGFISTRNRRRLVRLLNHPCVYRVGNHRLGAARSLIRAGVLAAKVVSYDFPGAKKPSAYEVKSPPKADEPIRIVFAGALSEDKGVPELLASLELLERRLVPFEARIFGTGAWSSQVISASQRHPGIVCEGRRGNAEVFAAMLAAHLVIVPSRHCFAEGLPFTLTEALASRTPVVCSDHPVFKEIFSEGEGVVYFPERRSDLLTEVILRIARDAVLFQTLSETTSLAFRRVSSDAMFGELMSEWISAK